MNNKFVKESLLSDEKILATAVFHPFRDYVVPAIFAIGFITFFIVSENNASYFFRREHSVARYPTILYDYYQWNEYDDNWIWSTELRDYVGMAYSEQEFIKFLENRFPTINQDYYLSYETKDHGRMSIGTLLLFFMAASVTCFGSYFITVFINSKDEFVITNKRVVAKVGVIRRVSFELYNEQVESIEIHQGIIGRILNFGTLMPCGIGASKVRIPFVFNPFEFRQHFYDLKKTQPA